MTLEQFSNGSLVAALILYVLAFISYVITVTGKKWNHRDPQLHEKRWGSRSFIISCAGLAAHLSFFTTRWIYTGHSPTSNMFEFLAMLGMMMMAAFIVLYLIYRSAVLGMFAVPVVFIIVAYASVFPWEAQPLIPALQNRLWLFVHVSTAALGEAFFAVGFAAGLMYLIRTVKFNGQSKAEKREQRGVEFTIFVVLILVGFIVSTFGFRAMGYEAEFTVLDKMMDENNELYEAVVTVQYVHPVIFSPHGGEMVAMDSFLGMNKPLFEAPAWMKGVNAGRKLNTVVWSVFTGFILYGVLRLLLRKPLGAAMQPALADIDAEDLDEISYRAIAIGFPIFTLGALIFAMIWAQIAWSRFWDWDPKEVWALITWLFYSAYLHLRLSRGWLGKKSSWLAVIGFVIVMFTLVGVNLIIAGLHSYAGV